MQPDIKSNDIQKSGTNIKGGTALEIAAQVLKESELSRSQKESYGKIIKLLK